jgi:hypothetical protein
MRITADLSSTIRLPARARARVANRVSLTLGAVFLLAAVFYLWTADTTIPLALHGWSSDPYNRLANAFLHLHLSVGQAPPELMRLANPYSPAQNTAIQARYSIHDYALYHGRLYLTWGPAPVIVLLVPMHLLGFEPSSSLTVALFGIVGLGFALATLRVLLRQVGGATLWMCALAASTLALCSVVPFILRRPAIYEEAIAGGFCFAMAGIWLATSTLVERGASLRRLALMSLCFGLAVGSRPTLGLTALVLVPVYLSLRGTRSRRALLLALLVPAGGCFLLLAAYNQARFGAPLEFGTKYALAASNSLTTKYGDLSYVPAGFWFYLASPPLPTILFPFIHLGPPPLSYPGALPANYAPEVTGGLLPMTPIVLFLAALPWIWRRRPALLGPLASPLLVIAGAGLAGLLFLSYEFYATTERYAVDFSTLFVLGALAAWLALSAAARGRRRRLVRVGGGLLALWSCCTGLAISFTGYYDLLATEHPTTWSKLEDIGSPLSTAIAAIAGHPILATISAPNFKQISPILYTRLDAGVTEFQLGLGEQAEFTIVSPSAREATLAVLVSPEGVLANGTTVALGGGPSSVLVGNPEHAGSSYTYQLPAGRGVAHLPVHLNLGLNRMVFRALSIAHGQTKPAVPAAQRLLSLEDLSLGGPSA